MYNSAVEAYLKTLAAFNNTTSNANVFKIASMRLTQLQAMPPHIVKLQNTLSSINMQMSNFYLCIKPLYRATTPALSYLKSYHYGLYLQINDILYNNSEIRFHKPIPHRRHKRKVNIRKAHELIMKSKSSVQKAYIQWTNLSESKFSMILFSIDKLIDSVDETIRPQLNILVIILVVLFIYTHTPKNTPGE